MIFQHKPIFVLVTRGFYHRYGESFPVSVETLDSSFCVPIGKAKVFTLNYILFFI